MLVGEAVPDILLRTGSGLFATGRGGLTPALKELALHIAFEHVAGVSSRRARLKLAVVRARSIVAWLKAGGHPSGQDRAQQGGVSVDAGVVLPDAPEGGVPRG